MAYSDLFPVLKPVNLNGSTSNFVPKIKPAYDTSTNY